ncbi:hypothetical protein SAMN06264364_10878 [Quadrisphaera granulorum]|uniref:Uncharacterized protein n=1 Tax=Quadrisphaera granulorum TaxID=317664 RepID=A0A316A905_9ACTN|nr:hypothetical protein [Quadrisphaera granulorum]PWJ54171.1 hypothetical protein BXY45_10878 [Quadrisphaera granulorum]SZE96310.1 hypothetical protein SAMN06264364_10878 [Quadrisphaera granulorum]
MARSPDADAALMARLRAANPARPTALDERAEADLQAALATQVGAAAPSRRRPLVLAVAAAVVVLGAVGVGVTVVQHDDDGDRRGPTFAAAGTPGAPSARASSPPVRLPPVDAPALLTAWGPQPAYDYPPVTTPTELASEADLVAVGELVAMAPEGGGSECPDGQTAPIPEVVMRLDRLQVVKGQQEMFTVLVVVPREGGGAPRGLPLGTRVLIYASAGQSADCQDVYRVTSPQGIALQAADGQVVWPLLGQVRDGDLSQALPGGSLIAQ